MKVQRGASDVIFPVPAALSVSGSGEQANIMTIAWIGMASSSPPTIGISLARSRLSVELIRGSGEFTVNFPTAKMAQEVDYCGLVSGRTRNKFRDAGLTPLPSAKVAAPIIQECPYNMECRVSQTLELGEWVFFLGEIVETHVDEACVDPVTRAIRVADLDPLAYCAVIREYWSLGQKLGNGFQAGRDLLHRVRAQDKDNMAE